ncbi:MAG TPA: invasion associated locus B family protein [Stellaceae bacterium]|nr:invasion associated locus B family protein [Stellaceae bacterium]
MTAIRLLVLGVICAGFLPTPAEAATKEPNPKPAVAPTTPAPDPGLAKSLGSAGSWTAYLAQNKAGKVCYLVGQPEKSEPATMKRKTVMATVTHRTEDQVANVVSFDEGYQLNEDDDVALEVGKDKFTLFAKDDSAWARTSDIDKQIVAALAKEKVAVVKANPKKGHGTVDTYSLAGFAKALALIDKACDVKR